MSPEAKKVLDGLTQIAPKKAQKQIPCRIRYNGHFVATVSGKSVWKHVGHAKNAMRHHVQCLTPWTSGLRESVWEEVMKAIEFVPVSEDE